LTINILNQTNFDYDSSNELISKLQDTPSGKEYCYTYQNLGVEIFNYLFCPDLLAQPYLQHGLNADGMLVYQTSKRPDAIYPIVSNNNFINGYANNLFAHACLFIAVDFKNLSKQPTGDDVDQVAGYLSEQSRRRIGILCTRKAPSQPALRRRYEQWTINNKLILFVTDKDLNKMINYRYDNINPSYILTEYILGFFSRLP
jgi:hypothetical protein